MPLPTDTDLLIESLRDELRSVTAALNDLHHPVYGGDARRIAELERRVEELRAAIAERRKAIAA